MPILRILLVFLIATISSHATAQKVPIVFHPHYDISFFGVEKFHPFDSTKYGKIAKELIRHCNITQADMYKPECISDLDLLQVHSQEYLTSLSNSRQVAQIAEMPILSYVPNFLLQRNLLNSMKLATGGTILGAQLAFQHGWAINLSGGYHHAKRSNGEGFCFFADIPLAIKKMRDMYPSLKVLVVDLDAHQGNGLEAILGTDPLTYIFDMYSADNYPRDTQLYPYIDYDYPLRDYITTHEYLGILIDELPRAIEEFRPDMIIYNAGTDIFEHDPLGKMSVSKAGIIQRDEFVFEQALSRSIPILMVLSGGYTQESGMIVAQSIENIIHSYQLVKIESQAKRKKFFKPLALIK